MDKAGIYMIFNSFNNRKYIGSSIRVRTRLYEHFFSLRKGTHHNKFLQRDWNKYGEGCFGTRILLYCPIDKLIYNEQRMIDWFKEKGFIFNLCEIAGNSLGRIPNLETREKIRKSINEYYKKNPPIKGKRTLSEESKQKIREARLNYIVTNPKWLETRQKISDSNKNREGGSEFTKKRVAAIRNFYKDKDRSKQARKNLCRAAKLNAARRRAKRFGSLVLNKD